MEALFEYLKNLISLDTVTGFEQTNAEKAAALSDSFSGGFFDGYKILPSGSILFEKKCGKPDAKKLILDAHIDTIGFAVSEHCGGSYVKVVNLGGADPYILPASNIVIHGKSDVFGVFSSIPPHLADKTDDKKLSVSDLFVDTGLPEEAVKELCPIGSPCTYAEKTVLLKNNIIASPYLDDKACCSAIMRACAILNEQNEKPECDIYVHFASGEERSQLGAQTLPYLMDADGCIVLDVNFAKAEGIAEYESLLMGKGPGISYSVSIKRELTDFIAQTASKYDIPLQKVVEMRSTGTNAGKIHRNGIPCAVLSVPLRNMHTYSECASLYDIECCAKLLSKVMMDFHLCNNAGKIVIK